MSQVFPTLKTPVPLANTAAQVDIINLSLEWLDHAFSALIVKNATTTAPPGSPGDEGYIIAATATGAWAGLEDYVAIYRNGWIYQAPMTDWVAILADDGYSLRYDGTSWVELGYGGSAALALTAGTTQTQGQVPLTARINQITTCANTNDVVTLPAALEGSQVVIGNDGANTLQVFPASGDKIDALSTDASTTIAAAGRSTFVGLSASAWMKL